MKKQRERKSADLSDGRFAWFLLAELDAREARSWNSNHECGRAAGWHETNKYSGIRTLNYFVGKIVQAQGWRWSSYQKSAVPQLEIRGVCPFS